jgi:hypothetical protein
MPSWPRDAGPNLPSGALGFVRIAGGRAGFCGGVGASIRPRSPIIARAPFAGCLAFVFGSCVDTAAPILTRTSSGA